jgi:hypothetical protein
LDVAARHRSNSRQAQAKRCKRTCKNMNGAGIHLYPPVPGCLVFEIRHQFSIVIRVGIRPSSLEFFPSP